MQFCTWYQKGNCGRQASKPLSCEIFRKTMAFCSLQLQFYFVEVLEIWLLF